MWSVAQRYEAFSQLPDQYLGLVIANKEAM
jgi:hypothetical protein